MIFYIYILCGYNKIEIICFLVVILRPPNCRGNSRELFAVRDGQAWPNQGGAPRRAQRGAGDHAHHGQGPLCPGLQQTDRLHHLLRCPKVSDIYLLYISTYSFFLVK